MKPRHDSYDSLYRLAFWAGKLLSSFRIVADDKASNLNTSLYFETCFRKVNAFDNYTFQLRYDTI